MTILVHLRLPRRLTPRSSSTMIKHSSQQTQNLAMTRVTMSLIKLAHVRGLNDRVTKQQRLGKMRGCLL